VTGVPAECLPKLALQGWARWGYAARGIVHAITGGLGIAAAWDARGHEHPTDGPGALMRLFDRPLGGVVVAVLAVGLLGFGVWRIYESFTERQSNWFWRLALRGAALLSFVTHGFLAVFAVRLMRDGHAPSSQAQTEETTAELLALPYGQWLVVALGVFVLFLGVTCLVRGTCTPITKDLVTEGTVDRGVRSVGTIGHLAQGTVLCLVGGFFLRAAWTSRPKDAASVGGVLEALERQPLGPWLLALVSVGLLAFGLFGIAEAFLRRMPPVDGPAAREDACAPGPAVKA
jgi:hypothetical protein